MISQQACRLNSMRISCGSNAKLKFISVTGKKLNILAQPLHITLSFCCLSVTLHTFRCIAIVIYQHCCSKDSQSSGKLIGFVLVILLLYYTFWLFHSLIDTFSFARSFTLIQFYFKLSNRIAKYKIYFDCRVFSGENPLSGALSQSVERTFLNKIVEAVLVDKKYCLEGNKNCNGFFEN